MITLTIGSYLDQILCDVLDMSACHILLGRPWQYDRRVKHDGYTNIYTLRHEGKLKDLIPLPPHKAISPPKIKQPMHLISRKSYVKEIKQSGHCWILFTKEIELGEAIVPREIKPIIEEFIDVFPDELPLGLPPIRGIETRLI